VVASYKEALAKSAPPKLVALSSMGSEKTSGLGLITSTHLLEEGLGNEPFPVAFVRAGSFYENYLFGLQAAQGGTLPIFYAPTERKLQMIATEDIGPRSQSCSPASGLGSASSNSVPWSVPMNWRPIWVSCSAATSRRRQSA